MTNYVFDKNDEEQRQEVLWDEHPDFRRIYETIVEQGRWDTIFEVVVQHKESGKFYTSWFAKGSTEMQDSEFSMGEKLEEVKPVLKNVIAFELVKGK